MSTPLVPRKCLHQLFCPEKWYGPVVLTHIPDPKIEMQQTSPHLIYFVENIDWLPRKAVCLLGGKRKGLRLENKLVPVVAPIICILVDTLNYQRGTMGKRYYFKTEVM